MEMEIILIVLTVIFLFIGFLKNNDSTSVKSKEITTKKTNQELLYELNKLGHEDQKQQLKTIYPEITEEKTQSATIVNNYYVQNNIYIKQEKRSNANSYNELSDHSEKVWKRLGYKIKYGESCAYRMYGNAIYQPHQVERIGASNQKLLSVDNEYGLTKNQDKVKRLGYALVNKCGSKKIAKNILVEKYNFDENTAKYAVGYLGYNDW